jgi:hypothetical protein
LDFLDLVLGVYFLNGLVLLELALPDLFLLVEGGLAKLLGLFQSLNFEFDRGLEILGLRRLPLKFLGEGADVFFGFVGARLLLELEGGLDF